MPTINDDRIDQDRRPAPDADLIRRMAELDDVDAFAVLFERHRVSVYRAALALTGDPGASEEVVRTPSGARTSTAGGSAPTSRRCPGCTRWRSTCATRGSRRRRLRSEPVTDLVAERMADVTAGPAANAEWSELRVIVREGIAGLSEKHRAVVVLYYLEGRSLQETADVLGLPLGTVKSRVHHALRDLRVRLSSDLRFGGAWGDASDDAPVADGAEANP